MKQFKEKSPYWEEIPNSLNVYHSENTHGIQGMPHLHDVFELLLVLSDGATVYINEEYIPLRKNTLLLFNRTDLHCIRVNEGVLYKRYVLCMSAEEIGAYSTSKTYLLDCFCRRSSPKACILPLTNEQTDVLYSMYEQLTELFGKKERAFGDDVLIHALLCQLLVTVNRFYQEYYVLPNLESDTMSQMIYSLLQYIYENYTLEITLTDLADYANVSVHYLCRLFKKVVGCSPMEYVRRLRITKAKELLIEGHSIADTCKRVGYYDPSNFSRQFKAQNGVSPQQYALVHRKHLL